MSTDDAPTETERRGMEDAWINGNEDDAHDVLGDAVSRAYAAGLFVRDAEHREVVRRAWDEGYEAHARDYHLSARRLERIETPNPYRAALPDDPQGDGCCVEGMDPRECPGTCGDETPTDPQGGAE